MASKTTRIVPLAPTPRFEPPAHFTTTSRTGHSVFIVGLKAENDYIKKMSKVILFSYEESAKEVQSYQNMLEKKHKECKGVEICEVYEQVAFFPTKGILSPQRFKERLENPQYILELYNNPSDAIRQVKGKGGLIMLKVLIGRCGEGNAKLYIGAGQYDYVLPLAFIELNDKIIKDSNQDLDQDPSTCSGILVNSIYCKVNRILKIPVSVSNELEKTAERENVNIIKEEEKLGKAAKYLLFSFLVSCL